MKRLASILVFAIAMTVGHCQTSPSLAQQIYEFHSEGRSRLVTLARLGAATKVSILVEAGSMDFLDNAISIEAKNEPLESVMMRIIGGPENYQINLRGSLFVIYPSRPKVPVNRLLSLRFGPITYSGTNIMALDWTLTDAVQDASECKRKGFSWAGLAFKLNVPPFYLPSPTFEDVLVKVAESSEQWMWVVAPDIHSQGCIQDPFVMAQVGLYNTDTSSSLPFSLWFGSSLVH